MPIALPPSYEPFVLDRMRVPSWMAGLLPESASIPDAAEVVDRLREVPFTGAREPVRRERPEAAWEVEAEFRFDEDGPPVTMRLWGEAPGFPSETNPEQLGLTVEEHRAASRSRASIVVSSRFAGAPLRQFHRQARVLAAAAPDAVAVHDLPSCRHHPGSWLRDLAASSVPPAPHTLFVIHTVYDPDRPESPVWMHTHGLMRCGAIEVEILGARRDQAGPMQTLMNTVAAMFMEKGAPRPDTPFQAGRGLDLVWLPWESGIRKAKGVAEGGKIDRDEAHSLPSGILFVPRRGLLGRRYGSPAKYVPILERDPLLYVSEMETERMALLARERLPGFLEFAGSFAGSPDWKFLVKLGYPVDGGRSPTDREHLWFEVHRVAGREIEATLLNDPFGIKSMKRGQRGLHSLDLLTDWSIQNRKHGGFGPDALHMLRDRIDK